MAARLRRELGIEVETVRGHYGEYEVLVDGETVVDGGLPVIVGVLPSARKIIDTVRERLASCSTRGDIR